MVGLASPPQADLMPEWVQLGQGRPLLLLLLLLLQVGDCVDFRQACSSGRCVTGWRSGVVLAVAPGSEWEGGRRLLIQPQHTTHHHHHHSHQLQGSTPSLTPDSPAAAALAAVAAAGGPTGGCPSLRSACASADIATAPCMCLAAVRACIVTKGRAVLNPGMKRFLSACCVFVCATPVGRWQCC